VEPQNEAELLQRCRAGDERAYRQLVRTYQSQVFSIALRMVRSREDAEDVAQEAFVRVFRSFDRYDPARPFAAWLYTIVSRLAIDHIRRRKVRPIVLVHRDPETDEDRIVDVPDPGPRPEEVAANAEEERRTDELIQSLPPHYRIVVMLRHQQDLSYEEIAEALKLPLGTVKARIHRARALLKKRIEGETS
jgi:RNA polymerase sigma-70 factor (ECF subfamily)